MYLGENLFFFNQKIIFDQKDFGTKKKFNLAHYSLSPPELGTAQSQLVLMTLI